MVEAKRRMSVIGKKISGGSAEIVDRRERSSTKMLKAVSQTRLISPRLRVGSS
jgi:hypothetical protein